MLKEYKKRKERKKSSHLKTLDQQTFFFHLIYTSVRTRIHFTLWHYLNCHYYLGRHSGIISIQAYIYLFPLFPSLSSFFLFSYFTTSSSPHIKLAQMSTDDNDYVKDDDDSELPVRSYLIFFDWFNVIGQVFHLFTIFDAQE